MREDELIEAEVVERLFGTKMSRRRVLEAGAGLLGGALAGPLIFTTPDSYADTDQLKGSLPYNAHTSVKGHITFWHHYQAGVPRNTLRNLIRQFNTHYPHVSVNEVAFAFGDVWTKNTAAVAAGTGMPDVLVSDRPHLWNEGAIHHVYEPVTAFAKRDHIVSKPFWPFTWYESVAKKQLWGIPWETDCRVLYYNRAMFLDHGFNPNKPPTTWPEMAQFADKLDKKGSGPGGWEVIGFNPLWYYGLDTWVWDNSGDWLNKKQQPTLDSARNIQTAEWLKSWVDRYGGLSTLNAISSLSTPTKDEFTGGRTPFRITGPGKQASYLAFNATFARANKQVPFPAWGIGLIPHNTGGKPYSFTGGFALSMPTNHHRSSGTTAAVWEFIKYMTLVAQRDWARYTLAIPTVEAMAKNDKVLNSLLHWKDFVRAVEYGHPSTRNFHDALFPGDVVGHASDQIMGGNQSAKTALAAAQQQALHNMSLNP